MPVGNSVDPDSAGIVQAEHTIALIVSF